MGIGVRFLSSIKTAIRAGEFKRSEMKGVSLSTRNAKTLLTLERLERQAASLELLPRYALQISAAIFDNSFARRVRDRHLRSEISPKKLHPPFLTRESF